MAVMPGDVFGRWTALRRTVFTKRAKWLARCVCGTQAEVFIDSLVRGTSRSCGCLRTELLLEEKTTHGQSKTKLYRVWSAIKSRCENPNDPWYPEYGGRGIKLHRRWHQYVAFAKYLGPKPEWADSIDRKNNNKGYVPGNVQWATRKQQARNRRNNRLITYRGITRSLAEWAELYGLTYSALQTRLNRQRLPIHEALTTPLRYAK